MQINNRSTQSLRILHIAPFNTAGIPYTLLQAERALGYDSRLITLHGHRFGYPEDICMNLPFMTTPGIRGLKRMLGITSSGDASGGLPPVREYSRLAQMFVMFRDGVWKPAVNRILESVDITSFDLIQLDGGQGFYSDSHVIQKLHSMGKTVICMYYGSDLRVRGLIPETDSVSSCNFTFEFDHLDLYPGINHIPFPIDLPKFRYTSDPAREPVTVGHAPSNRAAKGTDVILGMLESLKKRYPFEIMLIEGVSHPKALEMKSACSLFIDQMTPLGYGINAVEALAMGIPTFSSLVPRFKSRYPDAPIVEITPENASRQLIPFLTSSTLRSDAGGKSRKWVEQHHDAVAVVKKIHRILAENVPALKDKFKW